MPARPGGCAAPSPSEGAGRSVLRSGGVGNLIAGPARALSRCRPHGHHGILFIRRWAVIRAVPTAARVIDDLPPPITAQAPRLFSRLDCCPWLQLLTISPEPALPLRSHSGVKLNPQDPRPGSISAAMLDTAPREKLREHIDLVLPGHGDGALNSRPTCRPRSPMECARKPGWRSLEKVRDWLQG